MNTLEEKRSLLLEMIAFSMVDGQMNEKEYAFLCVVAKELNIEKAVFDDLFHQQLPHLVIKSEFERIQQFYRLALLMYSDGVMNDKEVIAINKIAIDMGLNPVATHRILEMMKNAPNGMIDPVVLLKIFQEQHN